MTTVPEIQQAIMSLSKAEFAELRGWLLDEDWERWEREFDGLHGWQAGRYGEIGSGFREIGAFEELQ